MSLTAAIEQALSCKEEASASSIDNRIFCDGAVVGQWCVLALIGQGGNGEVYRVEHVKSRVIGALKATKPDDEHLRKRFYLELEVLKKITSVRNSARKPPRGLRYLPCLLDNDTATQKKIPFFVVELLQDLEPPKKSHAVRKMILDVCEAVRELHKLGYLHRDIKLENLMWRKKNEVVLIDFGLACRIEDTTNPLSNRVSMTQGHIVGVGTEGASAPEQMFGHASVRSDIYALGAMADKCFGGKPPAEWGGVILGAINPRAECRFKDIDEFVSSVKSSVPKWALSSALRKKWAYFVIGIALLSSIFLLTNDMPSPDEDALPPPDQEVLYRRAVQGSAVAQMELGNRYMNGEGVSRTREEAVTWYRKSAEQGLKEAMYNLGLCYYNGDGVSANKEEAVKWFQKAAEKGLKCAQFDYGYCQYKGYGVRANKEEAVKWFQRAAEQSSEKALSFLVKLYANGKVDSANKAVAVYWYRKAAEQGNVMAQYHLGKCYANGDGVAVDKAEAIKWYQIAAEQMDANAQYDLGKCYYGGDGVPENKAEAVKWYRKAAGQANMEAQYILGKCYENGDGVSEDKGEAARWYQKAAEQGDESAREALRKLGQ